MSESLDFNPALPESRQFTPPAEGGNGNIHKPGDYHNLIWQTRSRVPENWELQLIATLETLFEQGAESLGELVNGLNASGCMTNRANRGAKAASRHFYRLTATEDTAMTTTVQNYLDKGLRGLWYPVLASWEVQSAPVGITRLGEQIVVWRNKDGQVQALEDRCPHRGARLSMGWNLGDRIACWYHGVEVAGNGEVKDVPAVDRCPLVGQQCVLSYSVHEAHGAIFLWFGVTADQQPDELSFPEELADSEKYSNFLCTAAWKCNYQYALENVMDPMHGTYLHSSSHSMAEGDRKADMVLQPTKTGFIFEKKGQSGVNFDWVELGNSGAYWMRLSIPYKKRFGPGGHFWIVGMVVPEDNDNCRVFFWRIRGVQGWQRDLWRFMYRNRLEKLHWEVLEQDRVVLESLAPNARDHEYLYQHDVGLSRLRRMMQKAAKEQLALREAQQGAA